MKLIPMYRLNRLRINFDAWSEICDSEDSALIASQASRYRRLIAMDLDACFSWAYSFAFYGLCLGVFIGWGVYGILRMGGAL